MLLVEEFPSSHNSPMQQHCLAQFHYKWQPENGQHAALCYHQEVLEKQSSPGNSLTPAILAQSANSLCWYLWFWLHQRGVSPFVKEQPHILHTSLSLAVALQSAIYLVKGGKFLKKLWCCVGGSITRSFGFIN